MRKNPMEQNIRIPILFLKGHVFCLKHIAGNRHKKKKLPFLPLIFSLLYWYHHPRKSTIKWKTVRLCMIEFKNSCNLPRMNSILHLIFFSKLRFLEHILLSAGNISNGLCVSWTTEWWQIHQFFAYM